MAFSATLGDGFARCRVCENVFRDPVMIPLCGHSFCSGCVSKLPVRSPALPPGEPPPKVAPPKVATCPMCSQHFDPKTVITNFPLARMLAKASDGPANAADAGAPPPTLPVDQWTPTKKGAKPEMASPSLLPSPPQTSPYPAARPRGGAGDGGRPSLASTSFKMDPQKEAAREARVRQLEHFGMPGALAELVEEQDRLVGLRTYILDNSGSTGTCDGQYFPKTRNQKDGQCLPLQCSRWEEIKAMALSQAKLNLITQTPCNFFLLNPSLAAKRDNWSNLEEGRDFVTLNPLTGTPPEQQMDRLVKMLENADTNGVTPLAECIAAVGKQMHAETRSLLGTKKKAYLVIVTDGLPSDKYGKPCASARKKMVHELRKLCTELPLFVVIRLCTSEEDVVDFYNGLDEEVEFPLDVLDDLESEALEINKMNKWLNYFPVLHTIREGGTNIRLFDLMDERPFTGGEIATFSQLMLCRRSDPPLPHWQADNDRFKGELAKLLGYAPNVYNPVKRTLSPVLNLKEVTQCLKRAEKQYTQRSGSTAGAASNGCSCVVS